MGSIVKGLRVLAMVLLVQGAALAPGWAGDGRAPARTKISQALAKDASAKLAASDAMAALTLYESALVADPRNTAAYVGLGRTYEALKRPKDSMRYYELALAIDPNDVAALEAQSMAFLAAGDIAQAEQNLNRLRRICVSGCAALERVDAAIARALDERVAAPAEEAKGGVPPAPAQKG